MFSIPMESAAARGATRNARKGDVPPLPGDRPMPLARTRVGEPYGIWGGLSESERELLLKRGIRRTA